MSEEDSNGWATLGGVVEEIHFELGASRGLGGDTKELLDGELVQGSGEAEAGGEDGSVIKWLRATDDLDTALDMLKEGQGPKEGQGEERWLDQVATAFYDRNAPRGL